jgi:hypothetical protein
MNYVYRPLPDLFEGSIEISIPKYKERLDLVKRLNVNSKDGEISVEQFENISMVRDIVGEFVTKVELVVKESGQQISCLDDLEYYESFNEILGHLSGVLFNGIKLGNAKKD